MVAHSVRDSQSCCGARFDTGHDALMPCVMCEPASPGLMPAHKVFRPLVPWSATQFPLDLVLVHGWCSRDGQVSEARSESTFLADGAACLTLVRAVVQLRCFEIVFSRCGLLSCVVCGVSSMDCGFRQFYSFSLIAYSPSASSRRFNANLQYLVRSASAQVRQIGISCSCLHSQCKNEYSFAMKC